MGKFLFMLMRKISPKIKRACYTVGEIAVDAVKAAFPYFVMMVIIAVFAILLQYSYVSQHEADPVAETHICR